MADQYAFRLESFTKGKADRGVQVLERIEIEHLGFDKTRHMEFDSKPQAVAAAGTWVRQKVLTKGPSVIHVLTVFEVRVNQFVEVAWATVVPE